MAKDNKKIELEVKKEVEEGKTLIKEKKSESTEVSNTASISKKPEEPVVYEDYDSTEIAEKPKKNYVSNYNLIVKDISKEIEQLETEIISEKQYKNLNPILLNKKNHIKTNNDLFITSNRFLKSNINKNNMKYLSTDAQIKKRRRYNRRNTDIIIEKLNIKRNYDKVELKDVKRKLKLTEYIIYNKAKDKLKLRELGKDELYEYTKKEDNEWTII